MTLNCSNRPHRLVSLAASLGLGVTLAVAMSASTSLAAPPSTATPAETTRATTKGRSDVAIVGAKVYLGDGRVIEDGLVTIKAGKIQAVRENTGAALTATEVIDGKGKIVTPGFIGADTSLGLVEIELESSTRDQSRDTRHHVRAAYDPAPAIFADSSLIQIQAIEGITSAAVAPSGGLFSGQVAWIDLLAGDYRNIVVESGVAVDASYGQIYGDSRAATLAEMRRVLDDARLYARSKSQYDRRQLRDLAAHPRDLAALQPVLAGQRPLTVEAHRAGDMLALIELARDYDLDLVIVGGSEAWKVADALAEAKVPVVLRPSQNLPRSFDMLGARLDAAALLHAAGVSVAIANPGDAHNVRNIKQEAGIAVAYGLPYEAAISAVTLEVARAYGMDDRYGSLEPGKVANVVVWPGDPFELSSWPDAVYIRGEAIPMRSRQTELRDRYLQRHRLGPAAR